MTITQRIDTILQSIHQAEIAAKRQPGEVKLLAVSKGQTAQAIKEAFHAGLNDFGENYLQEALVKMKALSDAQLSWHYLGPIQSNKAQSIAQHFAWVHSVSRLKIATALNNARPHTAPPLNICVQVNYDHEDTKSGIHPEEVAPLISAIITMPCLRLRGLMMIPKPLQHEQEQYESFLRLNHLLKSLNTEFQLNMDTLSMGMSNDFKAAIQAGSTMVRIGQALFGKRQ